MGPGIGHKGLPLDKILPHQGSSHRLDSNRLEVNSSGLCHKLQTTVRGPAGGRKEKQRLIWFFRPPPQLPNYNWLGKWLSWDPAPHQTGTFLLLSASQRAQEECQGSQPPEPHTHCDHLDVKTIKTGSFPQKHLLGNNLKCLILKLHEYPHTPLNTNLDFTPKRLLKSLRVTQRICSWGVQPWHHRSIQLLLAQLLLI